MSSWLFGIITNKLADLALSFCEDSRVGRSASASCVAWGVGWYEGSRPEVVKGIRPTGLPSSDALHVASSTSRIFILYLDDTVIETEDQRNLDPFHYRNWLFAERGNIRRENFISLLEPAHAETLAGDSSGEAFFHWIVQNIKKTRDLVPSLLDSLRQVSGTDMSFLLSNGRWLFAYRNGQPLYYLERRFPASELRFHYQVPELKAEVSSTTLASESAVLVSSTKLAGETWTELPDGYLLAVTPRLDIITVDLAERHAEAT